MNDVYLRRGLDIHRGQVTCEPVAQALGLGGISAESVVHM